MTANHVQDVLQELADPDKAEHSTRFFKTGPGEYGEGDQFRGLKVPEQRKIAKQFDSLPLDEVEKLLQSPWHEDRLTALFILVNRYQKKPEERRDVVECYIDNLDRVNNWDLVDSSAEKILGHWMYHNNETPTVEQLKDWARSDDLWKRRIAMMTTFYFIKHDDFDHAFEIAELLVHDDHDLIHKAVGWMLREIGNRDRTREQQFLDQYVNTMPRTMLRYAIEKFPEELRQQYLNA